MKQMMQCFKFQLIEHHFLVFERKAFLLKQGKLFIVKGLLLLIQMRFEQPRLRLPSSILKLTC